MKSDSMERLSKKTDVLSCYNTSIFGKMSEKIGKIKNNRLGKFIYNTDPNKFSLYNPNVEGRAIKEGLSNVAYGIKNSVEETAYTMTHKDNAVFWLKKNKIPLITLGVAIGVGSVIGYHTGNNIREYVIRNDLVEGKGWDLIQESRYLTKLQDVGKAKITVDFNGFLNPGCENFVATGSTIEMAAKNATEMLTEMINSPVNQMKQDFSSIGCGFFAGIGSGLISGVGTGLCMKYREYKKERQKQ